MQNLKAILERASLSEEQLSKDPRAVLKHLLFIQRDFAGAEAIADSLQNQEDPHIVNYRFQARNEQGTLTQEDVRKAAPAARSLREEGIYCLDFRINGGEITSPKHGFSVIDSSLENVPFHMILKSYKEKNLKKSTKILEQVISLEEDNLLANISLLQNKLQMARKSMFEKEVDLEAPLDLLTKQGTSKIYDIATFRSLASRLQGIALLEGYLKERPEVGLRILDLAEDSLGRLGLLSLVRAQILDKRNGFSKGPYEEAIALPSDKAFTNFTYGSRLNALNDPQATKYLLEASNTKDGRSCLSNFDRLLEKEIGTAKRNSIEYGKNVSASQTSSAKERVEAILSLIELKGDSKELKKTLVDLLQGSDFLNQFEKQPTAHGRNPILVSKDVPNFNHLLILKSGNPETLEQEFELAYKVFKKVPCGVSEPLAYLERGGVGYLLSKLVKSGPLSESVALQNLSFIHRSGLEGKEFDLVKNLERRFISRYPRNPNLDFFLKTYANSLQEGDSEFFLHTDAHPVNVVGNGIWVDWEPQTEGRIGNPLLDITNFLISPERADKVQLASQYIDYFWNGQLNKELIPFYFFHNSLTQAGANRNQGNRELERAYLKQAQEFLPKDLGYYFHKWLSKFRG